jgi:hypothetical protein
MVSQCCRYFELPSDAATRELRDVVEWFAKAALTPCPAGRDGDPKWVQTPAAAQRFV